MNATDATRATRFFTLPVFDVEAVYAERVLGRRVVYLDHNVWIDLRDARTKEALAALDACSQAAAAGTAVFPVSYAAFSELVHVPAESDRRQHADLIDMLSFGVTLRLPRLVYADEAAYLCEHIFDGVSEAQTPRHRAFTSVPDHGGNGSMNFPDVWSRAAALQFLEQLRGSAEYRSVRWLVDHVDIARLRKNHENEYASLIDACRATKWQRLASGRGIDREAVLAEERAWLFDEYVRPTILRRMLRDGREEFARNHRSDGDGGARRLRELFMKFAPSLEVAAQLFAGRIVQRDRRSVPQDFWDVEHALLAPVYADAFVTMDRNLSGLVRMGRQRPKAARAVVLGSLEALSQWLDATAPPPS